MSTSVLDERDWQLVLHEARTTPAGCNSLILPNDTPEIRWGRVVNQPDTQSAPDRLALTGAFKGHVDVSEVTWGIPPAGPERPPAHLPLHDDVLPTFQATVFGAEARARLDGNTLYCEPGEQSAGLFLRGEIPWLPANGLNLVLSASGNGRFGLAVSDAEREAAEAPLGIGSFNLNTGQKDRVETFSLPANQNGWRSVTLLCPTRKARLELLTVSLSTRAVVDADTRGAWFWAPTAWLENADGLWRVSDREALNLLYVTIPVTREGRVEHPEELAATIQTARQRSIRIRAVIGDRYDVLVGSLPKLLTRIEAYKQFNAAHTETPIDGVQLDIEPYLIPGFNLRQLHWRERYIDTINSAAKAIDNTMALDLVMPVWWGNHSVWGKNLRAALPDDIVVTVMNYRTDPARLRAEAKPFLHWGQISGTPIVMALETGTLHNETRLNYVATGEHGAVWLFDLGAARVLLMFAIPRSELNGKPYRFIYETSSIASALTFNGDQERLKDTLRQVQPSWSAWSSLRGIAIHGLEERYQETP